MWNIVRITVCKIWRLRPEFIEVNRDGVIKEYSKENKIKNFRVQGYNLIAKMYLVLALLSLNCSVS